MRADIFEQEYAIVIIIKIKLLTRTRNMLIILIATVVRVLDPELGKMDTHAPVSHGWP